VRTPVKIGVVGLGQRGLVLSSAFDAAPATELSWLCDPRLELHARLRGRHPSARLTASLDDLLGDEDLDGVVVATPAVSHGEIAWRALEADKHVLVEAPLATKGERADDLIALAERRGRALLVAYDGRFHPGVRGLKKLLERRGLGDLYYVRCDHTDIAGSSHESIIWGPGSSDLQLVLQVLGDEPVHVTAGGGSYGELGEPDVVVCSLQFATGISAYIHLSTLEVRRVRSLTVVASRGAATFDERAERALTIRRLGGEIVSPRLPHQDPLALECEAFASAVRSPSETAVSRDAAVAVNVLEQLESTLEQAGNGRSRPDARLAEPEPEVERPVVVGLRRIGS
jgi:UDP-2-acetamido-3-amino-2,3-dideoxy-glucuronate N-acetyltransferase